MRKTTRIPLPKGRIKHIIFGTGTVVEADVHYTTIAFDELGTKKFVTSKVELEPSSTPAPAKTSRKKKATKKATS